MLNARLDRAPMTRAAALVAGLAFAVMTVAIAGVRASAQGGFATVSGVVYDPMGRILPNATLVLSNTDSPTKHEVRTNQTGSFEFVGLPAGNYLLEAEQIGFATLREALALPVGGKMVRNITLQIGSLSETIGVVASNAPSQPQNDDFDPQSREQVIAELQRRIDQARSQLKSEACRTSPIGGCLQPPMKIKHARPQYPSHLRDGKVQGSVIVDAQVGTDGALKDPRVVQPVDPDFASAALEAIGQWLFTPTLLDGEPIDTPIRITIHFSLQ
jgi:TonB family protein